MAAGSATDWAESKPFPRVTLVLLTYEPGERLTAEATLRNFLERVRYPEPISVHIADDGSAPEHRDRLAEVANGYPNVQGVTVTNAERKGYGASYNLASQVVHAFADAVIPLEDDWLLSRPLDLVPLVRTVTEQQATVQCVRLGYLGFTQSLTGEVIHTPAGPMLLLDPRSGEPHVFAGHARIESVAYERAVGPWPEGMSAGATEMAVAHRERARVGVAWPLNYGPASQQGDSLFLHVGTVDLGEVEPE